MNAFFFNTILLHEIFGYKLLMSHWWYVAFIFESNSDTRRKKDWPRKNGFWHLLRMHHVYLMIDFHHMLKHVCKKYTHVYMYCLIKDALFEGLYFASYHQHTFIHFVRFSVSRFKRKQDYCHLVENDEGRQILCNSHASLYSRHINETFLACHKPKYWGFLALSEVEDFKLCCAVTSFSLDMFKQLLWQWPSFKVTDKRMYFPYGMWVISAFARLCQQNLSLDENNL